MKKIRGRRRFERSAHELRAVFRSQMKAACQFVDEPALHHLLTIASAGIFHCAQMSAAQIHWFFIWASKTYLALLNNVKHDKVFNKETVVKWRCRNCGYVHEGKEAPEECPACAHPTAYYEVMAENY
ncbi:MAG: hypothetical protein WCQ90_01180, partial [Deltaproteobacteria bacterium]